MTAPSTPSGDQETNILDKQTKKKSFHRQVKTKKVTLAFQPIPKFQSTCRLVLYMLDFILKI
jgi:hypothetical protein